MSIGKSVVTLIALALLITSCSEEQDKSAVTYAQNAQKYFASGQLAEATLEIKNALRGDPNNPEIRWLAGQIYLQSGNNPAAIKQLTKALELGLTRTDADLPLLRAWMAQGELKKALDYFDDKEISALTEDAKIIFTDLLLRSGDIQQAETILLEMLESTPNLMTVRLGLARIEISRGEPKKAKTRLDQILEIEPDNAFANLIAAELELSNNNLTDAQRHFDVAAKDRQTQLQAELGNARILVANSKYEAAANALNAILAKQPNMPLALFMKGLTHYHLEEYEAAQETLELTQKMIPKHGPTLLLLGKMYLDESRLEQANIVLESLLISDPHNPGGRQLLAATKLRLKKPEESLKLIDLDSLNQTTDPLLLIVAGSAYIATGNLSEGSALLERASTLVENPALIRSQLARIYLASGDVESAIAEFRSLTESDHNDPQNLLLLAYAQVRQTNFEQAMVTAEKLEQTGSALLATNLKGAIELARKNPSAAQQHFETALKLDDSFIPAKMNLARLALAQEQPDEAQKLLVKILEIEPSHSEAVIGLAKILYQSKEPESAIKLLKNFSKTQKQPKPLLLLANLLMTEGQSDKAINYAFQAKELAPTNASILTGLAIIQRKQGLIGQAIETLDQIPVANRDTTYHVLLSQLARADDRPELAREALSQALQRSPESIKVLVNSISLELSEKNLSQAEQLLAQITNQNDSSGIIRLTLQGDIFRTSKQHQKAIEAYQAAFAINSNGDILNSLVGELFASGQAELGIAKLKAWLNHNPEDIRASLRLANHYMQSANQSEAIKLYERSLKMNPLQPLALNNLAWMYYEKGNQRAVELAKTLAALKIQRADILDTIGWVFTNMGNLGDGIEKLKLAFDLDPDSADVIFHLAAAYSRNDQPEEAQELLSQLNIKHPKYAKKKEVTALLNSLSH